MRKIYRFVALLAASGCAPIPSGKVNIPTFTFDTRGLVPDLSKLNLISCGRPESQQPERRADVLLEASADLKAIAQYRRVRGCDGALKREGIEMIREGRAVVSVSGVGLELSNASYVLIRNDRTCLHVGADASTAPDTDEYRAWRPESKAQLDPALSDERLSALPSDPRLKKDGSLHFVAITEPVRLFQGLPVSSGRNQVVVTYYGKCTKDRPDRKPGTPDFVGCAEAPVLKTVVLQLQATFSSETIPGVSEKRECSDDPVQPSQGPAKPADTRAN